MPSRWKPVDYMALILTSVISICVLVVVIMGAFQEGEMSETKMKIVGGITTSIIAIIAIYIGAKIRESGKTDNDPNPPQT